jgi:DAACS family dicarboxylate/amino acid:cation (Na+ or H+) symporter
METRRGVPLHAKILIGLVLGAVAGLLAQQVLGAKDPNLVWFTNNVAKPLGEIFLYLLFMIVVPLLFSALILGVGELGTAARVGRIGIVSLVLTVILSAIAVGIGFAGANLVKPGDAIPEAKRVELRETYASEADAEKNLATAQRTAEDPPALGIIPRNPFKEINRALEGGLLPFMFFALMFGLGLAAVESSKSQPVYAFFEGIFAASQKIIEFAMRYGPIGVFFLVFRTTATLGFDLIGALGLYVVLVLACLAIQQFVVYSLALKFIAKRNPWEFFRQMRTTMITAFATSSSNATLPTALKAATEEVGLPKNISSFVLTVGATANQNGTALFEGITILFLAQLFGVDLTAAQQLSIMGLAIVAGIGTAGIPGGAWPMIATILVMFKVPAEAIGIVIGIDRILDMSRTVLNVTGDMTIAACVAGLEKSETT